MSARRIKRPSPIGRAPRASARGALRIAETAFGPDEQQRVVQRGRAGQRRRARIEQEHLRGRVVASNSSVSATGACSAGQSQPPALFGGAFDDALPVRLAPRDARPFDVHFGALRFDRPHVGDAEFGRLLQNEVEAIAFDHRLREMQPQTRRAFGRR